MLINQNGKQITYLNSIIASQSQRIEFLENKLESQKPTGKKAVDYDPNERFARIEEIAYAHYEAAKAPEEYRDREAPNYKIILSKQQRSKRRAYRVYSEFN
jgi:hypothetical protein